MKQVSKKDINVRQVFGAHQIYQEIVNFPPEGVNYLGISKETKKGNYYQSKKLKEKIGKIIYSLKLPRMLPIKKGKFDIIHSSRGIIPLQLFSNKPWVMDIEYFTSFMGLNREIMIKNKFIRKFIKNRLESKNCKKILCHCESTKKSFLKYFISEGFKSKIDVLYPSSHLFNYKKKIRKNIRFLAVISIFHQKGGKEILQAFSNLQKKYPEIELWIKGDAPQDVIREFSSKNIKFFPYLKKIISREKLLKDFYFQSDALIYTTLCDSFGYSLIDGLVAGLPIITTNLFNSPDVVEHNKNGIVIPIPGYKPKEYIQEYPLEKFDATAKKKFIKSLESAMETIIKNKPLREKMGRNSLELIKTGKYSLIERNKKLRAVYDEALNK